MKLLPKVKKAEELEGFLSKNYIKPYTKTIDERLKKAIDKLECKDDGVELIIETKGTDSEKYTLEIGKESIKIVSDGLNGAFYAIQTLRQILKNDVIHCLHIEDEPDFSYRGLYHDMTRGKIATVDTLKKLIDTMAYYKMNSLQIYVEHTFEFEETKDIIERTGYITKEEIEELDRYCDENFIEFIPSIATFGHMYEILEQDKYKHLRVLKNYETPKNFWLARMRHHTIDPLNDESFEMVKSLIDQYYPLFKTDKFNICGDETFDLKNYDSGADTGKLYFDFIQKIINHVKSKGKKVMMWADILLEHPELIDKLPDDIYFLNWDYSKNPNEKRVEKLAQLCKKQIVCPGTSSWSRLCENVDCEEQNISRMIEYGYRHGAIGVLNTNWGDYANPASIELAMYGITLGAVKSWAVDTETDDEFYAEINDLLYGGDNAIEILRKISDVHNAIGTDWNDFCSKYIELRYGEVMASDVRVKGEEIQKAPDKCMEIVAELSNQKWTYDEARQEMIICAEGICVLAQLWGKMLNIDVKKYVDEKEWLKKYQQKWLKKNKESELTKISEMILWLADM